MTRSISKAAFVALGMVASVSTWAVPLSVSSISGPYAVWDGPGAVLSPVASTLPNAVVALGGNALFPGGNVELNKFGGVYTPLTPVTVLTGTGGGHTVTLSSLTLSDWTSGSNALATRYIQDASYAAFGFQLNGSQLGTALTNFFSLDINPGAGILNPWQAVSDPNISYIDITGNAVTVGLAGLMDASPFLTGISGIPLAPGKQASEVVKLTIDGSGPSYLYGFVATPSGVASNGAFTGNYEVSNVPEPGVLALFSLGLVGMFAARRRRS